MRESRGGAIFAETNSIPRPRYSGNIMHSDPNISMSAAGGGDDDFPRNSSASAYASPGGFYDPNRLSADGSPMTMSPWNQTAAAPWSARFDRDEDDDDCDGDGDAPQNSLIGSLIREEGHIYSLAASGDLLYTGSDSKNIRVWKNLKEFSGFKSNSGLVKAIVISGEKIFTGHQDGKIRVWKGSPRAPGVHRRSGTLPTLRDILKSSINPANYVEATRRHRRSALWIKHSDAVSCMSLNEDQGLLYTASWDRTVKVWRISDSKCLESIAAHDDAVNAVAASAEGLVFTGSADGSVKMWRREGQGGKGTRHAFIRALLKQDSAVTALAVEGKGAVVYSGSSDGLVNFWERERHLAHGGVLKGHKLAVLCLAAAGSLVFSGSADKTICVWRREGSAHTCLSVLTGHTGPVKCLAAEAGAAAAEEGKPPRGRQRWIVYSGSLDKSVKVWSVSERAPNLQQMMAPTTAQPPPDEGGPWESFRSDRSERSVGSESRGRNSRQ